MAMENKKLKKLMQASAAASTVETQHILFSISPDGKVLAAGTDNMVTAMLGNADMFSAIKTLMKDSMTKEAVVHANTHQLDYPRLPCSPFSAQWKDVRSSMVRGILRKMLMTAGYGRDGQEKKLGVGPAPAGWPADIDWVGFKGSTRSKLKVDAITRIIVSMLEAAGFSPIVHVEDLEENINQDRDYDFAPDDVALEVEAEQDVGDNNDIVEVVEYDVQVVENHNMGEAETSDGGDTRCSRGIKRKYGSA